MNGYIMEIVPRDLLLIIFRYLHSSYIEQLNEQFNNEVDSHTEDHYLTHHNNKVGKYYNYRPMHWASNYLDWNSDPLYNKLGVAQQKLPARYYFSLNKEIDLNWLPLSLEYIMNNIPRDVLVIIFRYLHRTTVDQLNTQFHELFDLLGENICSLYRRDNNCKSSYNWSYNWRDITGRKWKSLTYGYVLHPTATFSCFKLPTRYFYSLNKEIDLNWLPSVRIMENVPHDILLIIFRYLHRSYIVQLNEQFYKEIDLDTKYHYLTHHNKNNVGIFYNYRQHKPPLSTYVYDNFGKEQQKLPARYYFSLNKQIDLNWSYSVHKMENVPHDVLLIIFRYLHCSYIDQLNSQLNEMYSQSENYVLKYHNGIGKYYNYRNCSLNSDIPLALPYFGIYNAIGKWAYYIPKRYLYSFNKEIDLNWLHSVHKTENVSIIIFRYLHNDTTRILNVQYKNSFSCLNGSDTLLRFNSNPKYYNYRPRLSSSSFVYNANGKAQQLLPSRYYFSLNKQIDL